MVSDIHHHTFHQAKSAILHRHEFTDTLLIRIATPCNVEDVVVTNDTVRRALYPTQVGILQSTLDCIYQIRFTTQCYETNSFLLLFMMIVRTASQTPEKDNSTAQQPPITSTDCALFILDRFQIWVDVLFSSIVTVIQLHPLKARRKGRTRNL